MGSFVHELRKTFGSVGVKTVTANDVRKGAYVVSRDQRAVLASAGKHPGTVPGVEIISLHVLHSTDVLKTSYYNAIREGSGRVPETRMGRELLNWARAGDRLLMATDGAIVFVYKVTDEDYEAPDDPLANEERVAGALSQIDKDELLRRARSADPSPRQSVAGTAVYERDPFVKAWAIRRSGYRCEVPGCDYSGFPKADGNRYIETHHIVPLAEDGRDEIANVVALCPNCHREAHYSVTKKELAEKLRRVVGDGM